MTSRVSRVGLWVSAALLVVALGLPSGTTTAAGSYHLNSWYVAGGCVQMHDLDGWAYSDCSPGFGASWVEQEPGAASDEAGMVSTGRFAIVLGLVLVATALRARRSAMLLPGGIAVGALAIMMIGLAGSSGSIATLLAAMLLVSVGLAARRGMPLTPSVTQARPVS